MHALLWISAVDWLGTDCRTAVYLVSVCLYVQSAVTSLQWRACQLPCAYLSLALISVRPTDAVSFSSSSLPVVCVPTRPCHHLHLIITHRGRRATGVQVLELGQLSCHPASTAFSSESGHVTVSAYGQYKVKVCVWKGGGVYMEKGSRGRGACACLQTVHLLIRQLGTIHA